MSEDHTPALELRDITHAYGDVSVLEDVSVTVERGSVVALLGPNGSGKTTLLSIATGLRDPDSGSVSRRQAAARTVGYVPQRPAFRPQFSVAETIEFYGTLVSGAVDVPAVLDRVGLTAVADRHIPALSGGMVRLLGLAQATIGEPPLLTLDEPASGLDPQLRHHIADVIVDIAADGTAVLLATHDLAAAERIADEILVLDGGSIVARGSPAHLREQADTDSLEGAFDAILERDGLVGVRASAGGETDD
ncbi:ABC transporter ATP-binding protein [Halorhabdus sp. CUG00001]|uniref:ABC transporter ATP-binding protein n=1 Tax=Halorhabdus sp. CUG00001 TaxID=2600297 RepID=UPI00131B0E39|nr:ABC transporter ATP-binding protein [Halorhabdus sp. CUG00001]